MSNWNRDDTVGVLKVLLYCVVVAVLSCFVFGSYVNDPNSLINHNKRTEERLERIKQKIEMLHKDIQTLRDGIKNQDR